MLGYIVRWAIGFPLAGFGVLCAYWLVTLWGGSWWNLAWKVPLACLLLVTAILSIDNGLGLITQGGDTRPRTVIEESASSKRLFVLFHGYNGRGNSLMRILAPYLEPYGQVIAFEPSLEGYNDDEIVAAAAKAIEASDAEEIILYGESSGGLTAMQLLRVVPELKLKGFVPHAVPTRPSYLQGPGGKIAWLSNMLHGGPLSTWALRKLQQHEVGYLPEPGSFRETVATWADRASLTVTAPMVLSQVRSIANFPTLKPREFAERVENTRYLQSPGTADTMVNNAKAVADMQAAFPGMITREMPWAEGEHTPTPRYGREVAEEILLAAGIH